MKPKLLMESFSKATRPLQFYTIDDMEQTPSLHARATAVKEQLHARKSIREREQHNKEEYLGFMELFNKDLIFRLKVTQQYYLLRSLFEDPKLQAKWAELLDELEAEDRNRKRVRDEWTEYAQTKSQTLINQTQAHSNHPALHWTHPAPNASGMEQWAHYENELNRITYNYHQERAAINLRAIDTHINHLNNVIAHLRAGGDENRELVHHLEEQLVVVHGRRQHLLNSPPPAMDHPHGPTAMQKYGHDCETLEKDIQSALHELHQRPEMQNEKMVQAVAKHAEDSKLEQEQLRNIAGDYEKERKILAAKIESIKTAEIAKLVERIDSALSQLAHTQEGLGIPEAKRNALEQSVARLEQLKTALGENPDNKSVQAIKNEVERELRKVHRLVSEKVIAPLHHQHKVMEPEPKYKIDNEPSPPPAAKEAEPPEQQVLDEEQPGAPQVPPAVVDNIISIQQNMRANLQEMREDNSLIRIVKDIDALMTKKIQAGAIPPEAEDIVAEIQKISAQIKSNPDKTHISQETIETLNEHLIELVGIIPGFAELQENLDRVVTTVEESSSPASSMS